MDMKWDDEAIKKALKGRVPEGMPEGVSQRAWDAVEKKAREGRPSLRGPENGVDWTDEAIEGALKAGGWEGPSEEAAQRVWASIERSVREGKKPRSEGFSAGPWGGTLRYAAAAVLLLVGAASYLEVRDYRREGRIANYLEALTEGAQEADEAGPVWVSAFLSEPLDEEGAEGLLSEEDEEPAIEEGGAWL